MDSYLLPFYFIVFTAVLDIATVGLHKLLALMENV